MIASLTELDRFRAVQPLPANFDDHTRHFFSPVDEVHAALVYMLKSVQHSLIVSMYGYDDDEANGVIRSYITNPDVFVQINLDKSQAGGVHEKKLLASWTTDELSTSIAIGNSAKHAISHLKMVIVDGLDVITGSTNWSDSGETKQDNHLVVLRSAALAAECRTRLDAIHQNMREQMKNAAGIKPGALIAAATR